MAKEQEPGKFVHHQQEQVAVLVDAAFEPFVVVELFVRVIFAVTAVKQIAHGGQISFSYAADADIGHWLDSSALFMGFIGSCVIVETYA